MSVPVKNEQEQLDSRSFVQDVLEGAKGLKGRPTKIQKPTRPDSIRPDALAKLSKKRKRRENCRMARSQYQTASSTPQQEKVSTDDKYYLKVTAEALLKLESDKDPMMPCLLSDDFAAGDRLHATI